MTTIEKWDKNIFQVETVNNKLHFKRKSYSLNDLVFIDSKRKKTKKKFFFIF